jgi:hypothetical protein
MGELVKDSTSYGWQLDTETIKHSWVIMKDNIQNHIRKLNFGYKGQLRTVGVTYLNALGEERTQYASSVTHDFDTSHSYSILHLIFLLLSLIFSLTGTFVTPNEIECTDSKGAVQKLTARQFIVAVGGRPTPLECPGAELSISSDDIFMMVLHADYLMPCLCVSFALLLPALKHLHFSHHSSLLGEFPWPNLCCWCGVCCTRVRWFPQWLTPGRSCCPCSQRATP